METRFFRGQIVTCWFWQSSCVSVYSPSPGTFRGSGALDGRLLWSKPREKGIEGVGYKDTLTFKDGNFRSAGCDQYGLAMVAYTSSVKETRSSSRLSPQADERENDLERDCDGRQDRGGLCLGRRFPLVQAQSRSPGKMGEGRFEEIIQLGRYCISVAGKPWGFESPLRHHRRRSEICCGSQYRLQTPCKQRLLSGRNVFPGPGIDYLIGRSGHPNKVCLNLPQPYGSGENMAFYLVSAVLKPDLSKELEQLLRKTPSSIFSHSEKFSLTPSVTLGSESTDSPSGGRGLLHSTLAQERATALDRFFERLSVAPVQAEKLERIRDLPRLFPDLPAGP